MGCPDDYGITVPVKPTAAALYPQPVPHQPSFVLMQPSSDTSVGMRDPDDPHLWPDLFYHGKDVKEVLTGNWVQNAAHPALLLIHNKISPAVRRQLEECAGMDREDACFWKFRQGKAISRAQMQSEAWVKLNISKVCGQLQNLTCPAHPLNRREPVQPPACTALPDCPCGMSSVFRIATDDYIDNDKKDPYPTSLLKA